MIFTFFPPTVPQSTGRHTTQTFSHILTAMQTKATNILEIYDDSSLLQLFRLSL